MDVANDGFEYFTGGFRGPGLAVVGDFGGFVDVSRGEVDVGGKFPEAACTDLQPTQPTIASIFSRVWRGGTETSMTKSNRLT